MHKSNRNNNRGVQSKTTQHNTGEQDGTCENPWAGARSGVI